MFSYPISPSPRRTHTENSSSSNRFWLPSPSMLSSSFFNFIQKHTQLQPLETVTPFSTTMFDEKRPVTPPPALLPPIHRHELYSSVATTTISPAPVHSLPSELLGEIFQLYLADDDDINNTDVYRPDPWVSALTSTPSGSTSPLVLGQICSRWRSISLMTPMLWSSLAVYRPSAALIPVIRLWLARAGPTCPLSLSLAHALNLADSTGQADATRDILDLFLQRANRWQAVRFVFHDRFPTSYFSCDSPFSLASLSLPLLESALIDLPARNQLDADRFWNAVFTPSTAPRLHRVHWGTRYGFKLPTMLTADVQESVMLPTLASSWAQLTHLTMRQRTTDGLSLEEFLDILAVCRKLIELNVSISWPETRIMTRPASRQVLARQEPTSRGAQAIVLPRLRVCRINAWKYNSAPILNRLVCPALVSLDLAHACHLKDIVSQPRTCAYIMDFLDRSNQQATADSDSVLNLETFSLSDRSGAITEEDLEELLSQLLSPSADLRVPSTGLRSLSLDIDNVTERTLSALTIHSPAYRSRDRLSSLSVTNCAKVVDGMLYQMVTSRLPMLHTLAVRMKPGEPFLPDLTRLESEDGSLRVIKK